MKMSWFVVLTCWLCVRGVVEVALVVSFVLRKRVKMCVQSPVSAGAVVPVERFPPQQESDCTPSTRTGITPDHAGVRGT